MIAETDRSGPAAVVGLPPGLARLPGLARRLRLLRLSWSPAVLAVTARGWFGSCRSALVALAARWTWALWAGFCN